jgi:fibronectin-binding autotransporter adhesin
MKTSAPSHSALSLIPRACSHRLLLALAALTGTSLLADTVNWIGTTDNSWSTGSNWSTGSTPAAADTAVFNQVGEPFAPFGIGAQQVNYGTSAITGLVFGDGTTITQATTLTGTSLTLGSAGINKTAASGVVSLNGAVALDGSQTWQQNSPSFGHLTVGANVSNASSTPLVLTLSANEDSIFFGSMYLNGLISDGAGTLSLVKTGSGTLNLASSFSVTPPTNTFTGGLSIQAGQVNADVLALGTGPVSISAASTLALVSHGADAALNQVFSGQGTISISTGNTVTSSTLAGFGGTLDVGAFSTLAMNNPGVIAAKIFLGDNGSFAINGGSATASQAIEADGFINISTIRLGGQLTAAVNGSVGLEGQGGSLVGTITGYSLYLYGTGNVTHSGAATGSFLGKYDTGTATLAGGVHAYEGVYVEGGTLALDYSAEGSPDSNLVSGAALNVGSGASLVIIGKANTDNVQSFSRTSDGGYGLATIQLVANATANNLRVNLGELTSFGNGQSINFALPAGEQTASHGIGTTTQNNSGGTLGAWALVNGTDWASNNGTNIVAATYVADTWAVDTNTNVTGSSTQAVNSTTNSLRFNQAAAATVTLSGDNTIQTGGVLVTANVGAHDVAIQGGVLHSDSGLTIYQDNTQGKLTINSIFYGFHSQSLVKLGTGTLVLGEANLFSGSTIVVGGRLELANALALGYSNLDVYAAASVGLTGSGVQNYLVAGLQGEGDLTLGNHNLTVNSADFNDYSGQISGAGGLTKSGDGFLLLSNTNTYTGGTVLAGGGLLTNADHALGTTGTISFTGGTLAQGNDFADYSSRFSTAAGQQYKFAGYSTWAANLSSAGGSLTVTGGELRLTGTSTYSGPTVVNGGASLIVDGSIASHATVSDFASIGGSGRVGGLTLADGGRLAPMTSTFTVAGGATFGGGAAYDWNLYAVDGSLANSGWDHIAISGVLDFTATGENPFTFNLLGESLVGFDPLTGHRYEIASAGAITGFSANLFVVNAGGLTFVDEFGNPLTVNGRWSITQEGNNLMAVFTTSAIPEPSTYAAIFGVVVLGFCVSRRRRQAV